MHAHFILLALLGSVSAPEASTLPFPTSDLDHRAQDHNHSYGLITHGSSHGFMTHGLIPGSLPVDAPNHNATGYSGNAWDPSSNHTTAQDSQAPREIGPRLISDLVAEPLPPNPFSPPMKYPQTIPLTDTTLARTFFLQAMTLTGGKRSYHREGSRGRTTVTILVLT